MDSQRLDRGRGLLLIFARGKRPNVQAIQNAIADHSAISVAHEMPEGHGLELVMQGLTFDVEGLAPASGIPLPGMLHKFDCPAGFSETIGEAVQIAPGPHLSGATRSIPVVRSLTSLASALVAGLPNLQGVCWPPAASLMGPAYFCSTIDSWAAGGPFPALGLTAVKQMMDGALQSEGMGFFIGQELRIEPEFCADLPQATQLAVRLINHLVHHGTLSQTEAFTGPDGSELRLEPSTNGRFVRVWR